MFATEIPAAFRILIHPTLLHTSLLCLSSQSVSISLFLHFTLCFITLTCTRTHSSGENRNLIFHVYLCTLWKLFDPDKTFLCNYSFRQEGSFFFGLLTFFLGKKRVEVSAFLSARHVNGFLISNKNTFKNAFYKVYYN